MTTHAIEVDCNHRGHGRVVIGGTDVGDYVKGFALLVEAGHIPQMQVQLRGGDAALRVMGNVVIEMPDDLREFLIAAGWTAP